MAICSIPKRINGPDLDKRAHKVQKLTSIVHFCYANISRLVNDQRLIFDMVVVLSHPKNLYDSDYCLGPHHWKRKRKIRLCDTNPKPS